MDSATIYTAVRDRYTTTALTSSSPNYTITAALAFGYSAADLSSIPADSNLGVSCGNPLALANLAAGETVVDLGCGAGFDCFLAARKVGVSGHVIGVDMNEDMLLKARTNAVRSGITNTTFLHSLITSLPLESASAHVVISNCVINLVPAAEKPLVFKEIFRILRPGGRLAVSDILTRKELPAMMKRDVALYVGCVAGASRREEYEGWMREAGFEEVVVVDAGVDLNVYTRAEDGGEGKEREGCCGAEKPAAGVVEGMKTSWRDVDLNEWAGSFKIFAVKSI
ncbi:putative ubiE/COQ5 methyltransferase [Bimuria novae-zelandiae CBS 107.79]|uniref:Arsenite methyltransferase n=1 Tax=Bimuria novae-zelandiae CBS 107.79 TaxID=1447943 RepID=A0A6A5VT99_9PLEO|nr:putative ubiE/COQ5 methyltransferase [Bimuria novae-zelandiae CBS 107.79]